MNPIFPPNKLLAMDEDGFYFIKEKPSSQELRAYYHDKYYQNAKGNYEVSYTGPELAYFQHRLQRIEWLIDHHQPHLPKRRLLDVGCGEGFALAYFLQSGYSVYGIDFSNAGLIRQNRHVLDCLQVGDIFELIEQQRQAKRKYDVILLQNVLEHVINPRTICTFIRDLLSPMGLAVITVPNDFSTTQAAAIAAAHIEQDFWVSPPDHLSYFNTDSLATFFERQNWSICDLISDFPIDWFLFSQDSNYVNDPAKGKSAHFARVEIENMLHSSNLEDVVAFYRAAAKCGVGRNLTIIVRPR